MWAFWRKMDRVVYTERGRNVGHTSEAITLALGAMGVLVGGGATLGAIGVNSVFNSENKEKVDKFIQQDHVKNLQDSYRQFSTFVSQPPDNHVKNVQKWWGDWANGAAHDGDSPPSASSNTVAKIYPKSNFPSHPTQHTKPPLTSLDSHSLAKHMALH